MSLSPASLRQPPLRFLLYLEWSLLGLVLFSEFLTAGSLRWLQPHSPGLNLICWLAFAVMGLWLPQRKRTKLLYTALEFGAIAVASLAGGIRLFALLYVVLVLRSCLIFQGWPRTLVTLLAFLCTLATQLQRLQSLDLPGAVANRFGSLALSLAVLMGLSLAFLQLLVAAILSAWRSRQQLAIANQQLTEANRQLRRYASRIEDIATLQERSRIAREIHDSLGHSLTALNLNLEAAMHLQTANPSEASSLLTDVRALATTALQEVRQSVSTLRAVPLQGRSLAEAIAQLAAEFQRTTSIAPHCEIEPDLALPDFLKTAYYRIVQETLTNACKYAKASTVTIQLQRDRDRICLTVADNGVGFDPAQLSAGFGLQSMRDRTLALDGEFRLIAAPNQGCQICVCIPIKPAKRSR